MSQNSQSFRLGQGSKNVFELIDDDDDILIEEKKKRPVAPTSRRSSLVISLLDDEDDDVDNNLPPLVTVGNPRSTMIKPEVKDEYESKSLHSSPLKKSDSLDDDSSDVEFIIRSEDSRPKTRDEYSDETLAILDEVLKERPKKRSREEDNIMETPGKRPRTVSSVSSAPAGIERNKNNYEAGINEKEEILAEESRAAKESLALKAPVIQSKLPAPQAENVLIDVDAHLLILKGKVSLLAKVFPTFKKKHLRWALEQCQDDPFVTIDKLLDGSLTFPDHLFPENELKREVALLTEKTKQKEAELKAMQLNGDTLRLELARLRQQQAEAENAKTLLNEALKNIYVPKPGTWIDTEEKLCYKDVALDSNEGREVIQRFNAGKIDPNAWITSITRVQNKILWSHYYQTRDRIASKNNNKANEELLFHGCASNVLSRICEGGFDLRLSRLTGALGAGIYFGVHMRTSFEYIQNYPPHQMQLLLCHVSIGLQTNQRPNHDARRPPRRSAQDETPFDSIYGFINGDLGHPMYAVFDNYQAYPAYVITFQLPPNSAVFQRRKQFATKGDDWTSAPYAHVVQHLQKLKPVLSRTLQHSPNTTSSYYQAFALYLRIITEAIQRGSVHETESLTVSQLQIMETTVMNLMNEHALIVFPDVSAPKRKKNRDNSSSAILKQLSDAPNLPDPPRSQQQIPQSPPVELNIAINNPALRKILSGVDNLNKATQREINLVEKFLTHGYWNEPTFICPETGDQIAEIPVRSEAVELRNFSDKGEHKRVIISYLEVNVTKKMVELKFSELWLRLLPQRK